MLMAHPAVLRPLVEEYYALAGLQDTCDGDTNRRRLDDVCYTLCVATGTRDVHAALTAARSHLTSTLLQNGASAARLALPVPRSEAR